MLKIRYKMEGRNFFIKQIFYCFSSCCLLACLSVSLPEYFSIILLCLCGCLLCLSYSASSFHTETTLNVIYNKNKVLDMHIHRHPHTRSYQMWCLREFSTMWELKRAKKCKWKEQKKIVWELRWKVFKWFFSSRKGLFIVWKEIILLCTHEHMNRFAYIVMHLRHYWHGFNDIKEGSENKD